MSEMSEARKWVEQARELLGRRRKDRSRKELADLREGLQAFTKNENVRKRLPAVLTQALDDLGSALVEPPEDDGERQLYDDFRTDVLKRRRSLGKVLTDSEASGLDLALELAASQALLGQFEDALTQLQQASHVINDILSQGREGVLAEPEDKDRNEADLERDRIAYDKAAEELAVLVQKLDPMSRQEETSCTAFVLAVQLRVADDQYAEARLVVERWKQHVEALLEQDKKDGGAERRQRRLEQREAAQEIDQHGLEQVIAALREDLEKAKPPLLAIIPEVKEWNGGLPTPLEGEIGALAFEVERHLNGLKDGGERSPEAHAKLIAKTRAALKAMRDAEPRLRETYVEGAKKLLDKSIQGEKDKLQKYTDEQKLLVDKAQKVVDDKKAEIKLHLETTQKIKDANGTAITKPFDSNSEDFYRKALNPVLLKNASKEQKELAAKLKGVAEQILPAIEQNKKLQEELKAAQLLVDKAEKTRDNGLVPLKAAVENAKREQQIVWTPPTDLRYGEPLDQPQLDAKPSGGAGRIEFKVVATGKAVVPGETRLAAGAGQLLRATLLLSEEEAQRFRVTPPKELPVKVLKAAVTLGAAATDIEYAYGTPFSHAALKISATTTPPSNQDHAGLLDGLVWLADGKPLKTGDPLAPGSYALTVSSPATQRNFDASAELKLTLKVTPRPREIAWEGAAPTTFAYGTALTAKQLNATVKFDPPLAEALAKPGMPLKYEDEDGQEVKVGALLPVGEARRITAKAAAHANFGDAPSKSIVFKVEKAARSIADAKPAAIGAIVQSADLKQLVASFALTPKGAGEVQFAVDGQALAIDTKLTAGKQRKLSVTSAPHANYLDAAERKADIEVLGAEDKLKGAKGEGDELLKKAVHSTHKTAVEGLTQQIESLGDVSDEERFQKINTLLEETREIEAKMVRWTGKVPVPKPEGKPELLTVVIDDDADPPEDVKEKTAEEVVKLVKHGGLTREDVAKLVPSGTVDEYSPSGKYPNGFKFIWTTPSGVTIEVYGHGPTNADNVDDESDSKKGNLVRVKINGKYMKPNGKLTSKSTNASSHMALY